MPGTRRVGSGAQQQQQPRGGHNGGFDDDEDENIYAAANQRGGGGDGGDSARYGGQDFSPREYEDGGRFDDAAEEEYTRQQQQPQRGGGGRAAQYDEDDESINQLVSHANNASTHTGRGGVPSINGIPSGQSARRVPSSMQAGYGETGQKSYIAENAKKVIQASRALASARTDESKEPAAASGVSKHENFGRVPAYLTEAKNHLAAKKAAVEAESKQKDLGIPNGMILMPEDQRVKTLEVLNESQSRATR